MNNQIVVGSLSAISQANHSSLAETFVNCDVIVLIDTSSSMDNHDSRGGKTRYEVAVEELKSLQAHLPGKIACISFSTDVMFCPSGIPHNYSAGTNMAKALQFARIADLPDMKFFMISDGEPSDPDQTLAIAKTYKNHISTIYCGPEEHPTGRLFLEKLAALTGGVTTTADRARSLAGSIEQLLIGG
jgi:hypothetical protein